MLAPYFTPGILEAGCDEAGRGCLAGPVYAAAVILPGDFKHPLLNDSKKLSEKQRDLLRPIIESEAVSWAVASCSHEEIDDINILNASFLAMHRALDQLDPKAEEILVDGNRFKPYGQIPFHCMVKGDGRFLSIAAASVLAKTYRDEHMANLHAQYPVYAWNSNKGYPTVAHRKAIQAHGASPVHRRSFRLLPDVQGGLF
ncbi:MAG: ribonuclease HII [Bacteroidota bacterium]